MNYAKLQQDVNRLLNNMFAWIAFIPDFVSTTAQDVSITLENKDGTETTVTHWNIKKMYDYVKSAVAGEMKQTFYVNQEAGDDGNSGDSYSPLKTVREAISRTPFGASCVINIVGTVVVDSIIDGKDKRIYINIGQDDALRFEWFDYNGDLAVGSISNPDMLQFYISGDNGLLKTITCPDPDNMHYTYRAPVIVSSASHSEVRVILRTTGDVDHINIAEHTSLIRKSTGSAGFGHINFYVEAYYSGTIRVNSNSKLVYGNSAGGVYDVALSGVVIKDESGNELLPENLVSPVVSDADGNCRNWLSYHQIL